MARQVKAGDTVKVHYTGSLEDGTVFDSSRERDPLEFTVGEGKLIAGFENAVIGMAVGESKKVNIPSEEAFGPHREELVLEVEKSMFPPHINPFEGQQLQIPQQDGRTVAVTVTKITDDKVTLDANHPLAGKDLIFDIEVVEIAD
ncbi:MAG: peptidylprolyl isomerase [Deltaproteobacteria bacterium]|nr:MAG: peptidylprolyl isomerase [Deltaproteobacteria bacterium]